MPVDIEWKLLVVKYSSLNKKRQVFRPDVFAYK